MSKEFAEKLRAHIGLAQTFAGWVRDDPDWEILAPHPLSVVCFRYRAVEPGALDEFNERLMHAVNATGEIFISHTRIEGVFALRLAIGNLRTERADVEFAWDLLRRTAATLRAA